MRIAFYAPMKPLDAAAPSGDRAVARAYAHALEAAGHEVVIPSVLRTYLHDANAFGACARAAEAETARLMCEAARCDLWFTYHSYYRAPDLLGPAMAAQWHAPYAIAEASIAMKRAHGEWAPAHAAACRALHAADAVFAATAHDRKGLEAVVPAERLHDRKPFLDAAPFRAWRNRQREARAAWGLSESDAPVLVTAAMMRAGRKSANFETLAAALATIEAHRWTLLVAGDGPERARVEKLFARFDPARIRFLGAVATENMPALYAAGDLYIWPGEDEAYGMAYLEAAATARPAIGANARGVPDVIRDGETGCLVAPGDADALARAMTRLLDDDALCGTMGEAAARFVDRERDLPRAAAQLGAILGPLTKP